VERDYDIFEKFPDGSFVWRGVISGHEAAISKLRELSTQTHNELHLMHVPTNSTIAILKPPPV
jgi:hypothetical protein